MSNILIFPLPELGHILPTLRLTRDLVARGHRVTYITAPQFTNAIQAVGGQIEPIIDPEDNPTELSGGSIWYRFIHDYGTDKHASRFHRKLKVLLADGRFSLLLCDHILGTTYRSSLISNTSKRRCVLFSTSLFNWNEYQPDRSGIPTMVFCPEALELSRFRTCSKNIFYVESSFAPIEANYYPEEMSLTDSPLVIASFGTQSIRYRNLSEWLRLIRQLALLKPQLQFVVSAGRSTGHGTENEMANIPNLTVSRRIPQRLLLKRAAAMITHGGLGSVKEAIFEGVPLIVLPMLHDQPFNAMRIRHHGLGAAIFPDKKSLVALDGAVCRAVEGEFASSLAAMRSQFAALEASCLSHLFINNRLSDIENDSR